MTGALWWKTFREGLALLLACSLLMYIFAWMHVWLVSEVETKHLLRVLRYWRTPLLEQIIPVPLHVLVSPAGRIAAAFDHPLVIVPTCVWAIARGSDAISGEIGRGTMEVLLAQPIRRLEVIFSHTVVTLLGLVILVGMFWLGIFTGISMFALEQEISPAMFLPAASNLICMGAALAGVTTLLSSLDRYRTRTIGLAVGFFLVEAVLVLVSVAVPEEWGWLRWSTFLAAYQPQILSLNFWPEALAKPGSPAWSMLLQYDALLCLLALVCFSAAALIFCRRDLPAPL